MIDEEIEYTRSHMMDKKLIQVSAVLTRLSVQWRSQR